MATLTAFFEARLGRLYGFRFRDFADFKSCPPSGTISSVDQGIGAGDGARTVFDLTKRYDDDQAACERRIHKPVEGTVAIAVDGVELDAAVFAVDLTTGTVTLATPPANGAVVTAGYEFDVPVRFDADRIDVTLESFAAGRMAAVPLIEVRV
ncbi:uncharacterized protein (TIGR02217 family) [Brevundimonas alba]|uniref:Uncharacterized protein (TIGR02217 family) n=2 Tax=Brevundimonas alba TaxID=74314 RepID=A0A7X6BP23_9CAUL|nr:uncharacterized protein (TIGR02217 family) [Brevundimonas alba]